MALITIIPKRFQEGFQELASINDASFDLIIEGLNSLSPTTSIKGLSKKLCYTKDLQLDIVEKILLSVASLLSFLDNKNSIEEIANSLVEANKISNSFSIQDDDIFKQRLSNLLDNKQLYYTAKANDLLTEHANIFLNSRIVSDFRPIFEADVNVIPSTGIIFHNLHINYRCEGQTESQDIYIVLDINDLKELKEDLIRAEAKAATLEAMLANNNIYNIKD